MQLAVVGSGYVGLVTAACLADSGNDVAAIDRDVEKVRRLSAGEVPMFEPGLAEIVAENLRAGRLRFTTDLSAARKAEVVFLAVGTPPRADGSADLSAIESVARELARTIERPTIVVIKSTVPPGTGGRIESLIASSGKHACPVVSNPEFLKEGDAVNDFLRPDRVVIGDEDRVAGDVIEELFRPFVRNNRPILRVSRIASELTKYAANAYLATRISFINEISEICEALNVDVNEVRRGIGSDARIGQHFLYPGVGYGGSCFPKDVQALVASARALGADASILAAVHRRNQAQRARMLARIRIRLSVIKGRRIAVWGIAFKPKTDDIREAPAVELIEALLAEGASIAAYDPKAIDAARARFGQKVACAADAYAALPAADALLICTEWNEFRSPDFPRMKQLMKQPIIFDGRNLFEAATLQRYGFEYHSVGRPTVQP